MILQIAVLMSIGLVLSVSVVIKSDDQEKNRKFWSYITWRIIPQKTSTKLTFLSPKKNGSSFVTYVISTSLEIALKVSSSERKRVFYWRKVSKFLLAALFANARRVDVTCSKFRVQNKAIFTFLGNERLFGRKTYNHQITYLPKSYLWTKNEGNRFFNSCHSMLD